MAMPPTDDTKVRASIDSALRFPIIETPYDVADFIRKLAEYPNPAHAAALRRGGFVRHIEPVLTTLRVEGDHYVLPRGLARAVCRKLGARLVLEDRRFDGEEYEFTLSGVTPRPYQATAVRLATLANQGLIHLPTGAGKSIVMIAQVAALGRWALVIVGSVDLAEQMRGLVIRHLGIEPGMIIAGKATFAPVTIATWQSLRRPSVLAEAAATFGVVLVDEAHHTAADVLGEVVGAFPARYRLGFSGTITRTDGLEVLLEHHLGRVIHAESYAALTAAGYLARPEYVQIPTAFRRDYGGPDDWSPLLADLVANAERNTLICTEIAKHCGGGHVGLALTSRVEHAEKLRDELSRLGLRAVAIVGTMPKKERTAAIAAARAGELDVLVATSLADEGLDIPKLGRVALCFPARSEGRLLQRAGRVLRPHPDKEGAPMIIDFVDSRVGVLAHQAKARAKIFAATWPAEVPMNEIRRAA